MTLPIATELRFHFTDLRKRDEFLENLSSSEGDLSRFQLDSERIANELGIDLELIEASVNILYEMQVRNNRAGDIRRIFISLGQVSEADTDKAIRNIFSPEKLNQMFEFLNTEKKSYIETICNILISE